MNLALLKQLLSQPSAPFKEDFVSSFVQKKLRAAKVPFFLDPHKNIVIGAKNLKEYKSKLKEKSKSPLKFFIAHMDHPGFHGIQWISNHLLKVKWYGGSPTRYLSNSPVWIADSLTGACPNTGFFLKPQLHSSKRYLEFGYIKTPLEISKKSHPNPESIFGGFGFLNPKVKGKLIYTKSADDLTGVFTILSLFLKFSKTKKTQNCLGLLTRAEEVGFIGALGHLELGWLTSSTNQRKILAISLEASRTLPGALIGKGPVIRLGDRMTTFDPTATQTLTLLAQKKLKTHFQKRIMDGGSCEASATSSYGLTSVGISVPLGNYHNQCFEGGPDARGPLGPSSEFVHLDDVKHLMKLCEEICSASFDQDDAWKSKRKQFQSNFQRLKSNLL